MPGNLSLTVDAGKKIAYSCLPNPVGLIFKDRVAEAKGDDHTEGVDCSNIEKLILAIATHQLRVTNLNLGCMGPLQG